MSSARRLLPLLIVAASSAAVLADGPRRPIALDDVYRLREVRDPQCSPDGRFVAYVVSAADIKEDKNISHVWMVGIDGQGEHQMTTGQQSESSPRWTVEWSSIPTELRRRAKEQSPTD